jgi:hypothetical protein|tara:strand:+ start:650 stop:1225 length:576 start_codon:yes stop_codon:yes gene_type:complete
MPYLFRSFPKVNYSLKKNKNFELLTNITLRFKVRDIIKNRTAIYFDYVVKDSDRPDIIASKYYDDPSLDWIIFLVNDIVDPYYDWPLNDESFDSYMRTLYGSTAEAKSTVFEYRKIINNQSVRFDGKIIPKRTVVVDLNTYNSLAATDREQISAYDYYFEQNAEKRKIKILDKQFVSSLVREVDLIFSDLN